MHSAGIPLAYNAYAMSIVTYTSQLLPLDGAMHLADHIALARVLASPMYAVSPGVMTDVGALGGKHAPQDMRRLAWVCRLRAVLRSPGLTLAVQRVDAATAEDRCLAPRIRDWLAANVIADLRTTMATQTCWRWSRGAWRTSPGARSTAHRPM